MLPIKNIINMNQAPIFGFLIKVENTLVQAVKANIQAKKDS